VIVIVGYTVVVIYSISIHADVITSVIMSVSINASVLL